MRPSLRPEREGGGCDGIVSAFPNRLLIGVVAGVALVAVTAAAGPASASQGPHPLPGSSPAGCPGPRPRRHALGRAGRLRRAAAHAEPGRRGSHAAGDLRPDQRELRQLAVERGVQRQVRPGRRRRRRRAALASLAGLPGHQDPAQRDVRGGQRLGRAGREDLRHHRCTTTPTWARRCGPTRRRCPCRPARPRPSAA